MIGVSVLPAGRDVPHILIVEDSDTQALKLSLIFEDEGWESSRVATAEAALEFLNQRLPDLVVVDYFLPGMHGDAFCRQVRMRSSTRHLPLLMLTAADSESTQVRLLDSGADDYLPKTEDFEVLLLRIQSLLRKSQPRQAYGGEPGFSQARILAIDDSPTYLAFLEAELMREGYLVDTASNGSEGLAKIKAGDYDCVLVDLVMPDLDGIAVCQHLSQISRQMISPLLILMLTAHDNATELSRALEAGADDFVGKSNDISVLKGRVRALLRRKLSQDENQRLLEEIIRSKEQEAQHALQAQREVEARAAMATELAQALRLLQASKQELEQLAYISAHDLQEPLRHLTNYSQMLQRRGDGLDGMGKQCLQFILDNTSRMKRQVGSLLNYLSVSTTEPDFQPLEISGLLQDLGETFAGRMRETGGRIERIEPLPRIFASHHHLELLFWHLIHNALQFRGSEPPLIEIGCQEQPEAWQFWIQDNGIGIEPRFFEQIFDIFQHLHGQSQYSTSGMGLAICRKIVEIHHGRIWLESQPGQGSRFYFTIAKELANPAPALQT